ncbi:MAG: type II secretion system protein GspG, partial [Candidatus Binatia bacterium]
PSIAARSEVVTRPTTVQRADLTRLSMWVNLLVMLGAAVALARLGGPSTPAHDHVQGELRALAGLAEEFRARHGSYPDPETWRQTTEEADPRFLDPWGRPYRYVRDAGGTTIGTLGRDGRPSGRGDDADVSLTLPSPRS